MANSDSGSTNTVDALLEQLDSYARDYDMDDYGLPLHDHMLTDQRKIVEDWLAAQKPSPTSVRMPTSEDEAALMTLLGHQWLVDNAPHRLKQPSEPVAGQSITRMMGRESVAWLACHAKGLSMEDWNLHSNRLLDAIGREQSETKVARDE